MNIAELLDRPIAFHRPFVRLGAGVTGALMLSQAIYWSRRTQDGSGWFFKTQAEWEAETGLTRYEQEGARTKLVSAGVLKEVKRGIPCKLYFKVNIEKLTSVLLGNAQQTSMRKTSKEACETAANKHAENQQTGARKTSNQARVKPAASGAENPQPNIRKTTAETTAETTQEILPEAPSAPAAPAPSDAPAVVAFRAEPVIAKPVFPAIDEAVEVEVVKALPAVKAAAAKPARTRKPKADAVPADETALQAACRAAWGAYSAAYGVRYGALPVRNAKVNAAVKGIVQRLGAEEAPAVAAFFVSNVNDAFVVRACHDIGLLLKSAEGYRTQWATGLAVTQTRARQADQSAANYDAAAEAMAILRARRAARAAQAQQEGA